MADQIEKILSVKFDAQQAIKGMMSLNQQIEQNNADLKEMAQNGEKGSKAYAVLEQQTKALKKQKQDLGQAIQNEIKVQNTLDGSLRQLRAQLSTLTKQYDALSKSERENVNIGGKLQKQINDTTNEIKNAEQATQRYYRNVGNYQNSILSALGINNQFANSLISMSSSGQGVKGAFTMMATSAKAFGKSLWALMANPAFLAIASIAGAGMAFKWFYDYNVEIERAMRLTREFTGVTGDALVQLRAEIQATASTYGKDYKEVLEGVDTIMAHFHVTANEAIRAINDGFQSGADINGDMLQKLKQYAPTFKDAGISARELLALIQQTRSGIFSQQGLDAIKMGATRMREFSATTQKALQGIGIDTDEMQRKIRSGQLDMFESLQEVARHLKQMPDNAKEVGEVMSAVFGRQGKFAAQEMIENLDTISTDLDVIKKQTGEYGQALEDNRKATADLEYTSATMFGVQENGWETIKTRADTLWKVTLNNIILKMREVLVWFGKMYNGSEAFRVLANVIGTGIKMMTLPIFAMIKGIGDGFKAMGSWVEAFVKTFKSGIAIVADLGRGVGDILTGDFEKGANRIANAVRTNVNNALKGINTAIGATKNAFTGAYNSMDKLFSGLSKRYTDFERISSSGAVGGGLFGGVGGDDVLNLDDSTSTTNSKTSGTGKRGGSAGKGGSGKASSSSRNTEAEKLANQRMQLSERLIREAHQLEMKALQEASKHSLEAINQLYDEQNDDIRRQYDALGVRTEEEEKAFEALIDENERKRALAIQDYYAQITETRNQEHAKAEDQAKRLAQASLEASDEGTEIWLKWRLEMLRMEQEAELATVENNSELRNAIIAKYEQQATQIYAENAQKQVAVQQEKYTAIAGVMGGLGQIMGEFGEDSREAAILSKSLALGEVMIAQAVAIANAVKAGSNAVTPWQMIAQIATSVVAVTTAMVQAFNALDSAKFATGGYVSGAGTSTSDSIPVRVSNGESIMNANTTAMFSGLLSSLNQLGGGVPIQAENTASSVKGEDMLARAVARGVAMLPAPVVSVEDINRGQRQVQVMNERATL